MEDVKICCVLRIVVVVVEARIELVKRENVEITLGRAVRPVPRPATVETSCDVEI